MFVLTSDAYLIDAHLIIKHRSNTSSVIKASSEGIAVYTFLTFSPLRFNSRHPSHGRLQQSGKGNHDRPHTFLDSFPRTPIHFAMDAPSNEWLCQPVRYDVHVSNHLPANQEHGTARDTPRHPHTDSPNNLDSRSRHPPSPFRRETARAHNTQTSHRDFCLHSRRTDLSIRGCGDVAEAD